VGIDDQQVSGDTVRIRMSPDGHFWARATINGHEQLMLIDSGATVTALSEETAQRVGIKPDGLGVQLSTANGMVDAQHGRIAELAIGPLKTLDMGVVISPAFGDNNVLGMNFLSRLGSWRVEGKTLVLEPGKDRGSANGGVQGDDTPANTD
jgi:aspartyl protease family protein